MNILIANDDGINARGIHELAKALSQIADIYISAPDSQRSASGHGITMGKEIVARKTEFEYAKAAYSISGTPADCVKLGLDLYRREGIEIDIVFSGINLGSNLGTDILYSGTVSAAIEGGIKGHAGVAVSLNSEKPTYYEYAGRIAVETAKKVYEDLDRYKPIININVPDLPAEDVKGVKAAFLGLKLYDEVYKDMGERDGGRAYVYHGEAIESEQLYDGSDVDLINDGFVTITPLHLDLTCPERMDEYDLWCEEISNKIIY